MDFRRAGLSRQHQWCRRGIASQQLLPGPELLRSGPDLRRSGRVLPRRRADLLRSGSRRLCADLLRSGRSRLLRSRADLLQHGLRKQLRWLLRQSQEVQEESELDVRFQEDGQKEPWLLLVQLLHLGPDLLCAGRS